METSAQVSVRSRSCSPDSEDFSGVITGDNVQTTDSAITMGVDEAMNQPSRQNQVSSVILRGVAIVCLFIDDKERLCLAQISNTLLRDFSYNEIHNRRVALGITCIQCTPVQLEILRRAGAMPVSSRRCGMITKREAERLVKSFLEEITPPKLPENFAFDVIHDCGWGCRGYFMPSRYNSSRAKCIKCYFCNIFLSPNKFIFHCHRTTSSTYRPPDAANFNSWRRHIVLTDKAPTEDLMFAWEDVKAMFNGGSRKRVGSGSNNGPRSDVDELPEDNNKRSRIETLPTLPARSTYPYPIFPMGNPTYGFYGNFFQRQPTAHPAFPFLPMDRPGLVPTSSPVPQQDRCKFNMADILRRTPTVSSYSLFWDKNVANLNKQINASKMERKSKLAPRWDSENSQPQLDELKSDLNSRPRRSSSYQDNYWSSAFKPVTSIESHVTSSPIHEATYLISPTFNNNNKTNVEKNNLATKLSQPDSVERQKTHKEVKDDVDTNMNKPVEIKEPNYLKDENLSDTEGMREEIRRLMEVRDKADCEYQCIKKAVSKDDLKPEELRLKLSEAQTAMEEFAVRINALKGLSSIIS